MPSPVPTPFEHRDGCCSDCGTVHDEGVMKRDVGGEEAELCEICVGIRRSLSNQRSAQRPPSEAHRDYSGG